jgi:hypothetical protein
MEHLEYEAEIEEERPSSGSSSSSSEAKPILSTACWTADDPLLNESNMRCKRTHDAWDDKEKPITHDLSLFWVGATLEDVMKTTGRSKLKSKASPQRLMRMVAGLKAKGYTDFFEAIRALSHVMPGMQGELPKDFPTPEQWEKIKKRIAAKEKRAAAAAAERDEETEDDHGKKRAVPKLVARPASSSSSVTAGGRKQEQAIKKEKPASSSS